MNRALNLLLRTALMSGLMIVLGGASCIIGDTADAGVPEQNQTDRCDEPGVVCSDGCDADSISSDSDGNICASCGDGGEELEICGSVITAACFTVETPVGGECQQCFTDDGDILFDNCDDSIDQIVELTCRDVVVEPVGPDDRAEICEICTDVEGTVIRRTCRPEADFCEFVFENGLECEICTFEGEFAYRECAVPDLEPRVCEGYQNENGACLDCYGSDDQLLLHICEGFDLPGDEVICNDYISFEGEACSECFNSRTGDITSEECVPVPNVAEQCERLTFSSATCTVCSANGQFISGDCVGTCDDVVDPEPINPDGQCPAECGVSQIGGDTVCFICFDPRTGDEEEQCTSGETSDLVCEVIAQEVIVEDPNAPGFAPPPECNEDADCDANTRCVEGFCLNDGVDIPPQVVAVEECLVCSDPNTGVEVYRACEPVGLPSQPECFYEETVLGQLCEICIDPDNGNVIFDSCNDEPPPPPPVCEEREVLLTGEQGEPYLFEFEEFQFDVTAQCRSCPEDLLESCNISSLCEENQFECSPPTEVVVLEPNNCQNPWGEGITQLDELARVLAWANQIGVQSYLVERYAADGDSLCDPNNECDCLRGDTLLVFTDIDGAAVLREYGFRNEDLPAP